MNLLGKGLLVCRIKFSFRIGIGLLGFLMGGQSVGRLGFLFWIVQRGKWGNSHRLIEYSIVNNSYRANDQQSQ